MTSLDSRLKCESMESLREDLQMFHFEQHAFLHDNKCIRCNGWTQGGVRYHGRIWFSHLCSVCWAELENKRSL